MYLFPRLLAFLGRNWPFSRGTGIFVERPSRWVRRWPNKELIHLIDGRTFRGDLEDPLFRSLYLYGTYEPDITEALRRIVRSEDVVVDVGANVGLIAVLMGSLVGAKGSVYAFEPVKAMYAHLLESISLNGLEDIVLPFNLAVADHPAKNMTIHVPKDGHHPCSSMVPENSHSSVSRSCACVSLDSIEFPSSPPAVVKVDVEGAELLVLKGAFGWISSARPPVWFLEINRKTANRFGYEPEELASFLKENGKAYSYFAWSDGKRWQHFPVNVVRFSDVGTLCVLPDWAIEEGRGITKL